MNKKDFFEEIRNANKVDVLVSCVNADITADGKSYKITSSIWDTEELNNILNEKDASIVICRDTKFIPFVPVVDWEEEGDIINVQ